MDSRDVIEIPDGDDDVIRWPRTTAADVAAIVALFDPIVRNLGLRFGGHGLGRRWRSSIDALAHHAAETPYADNRTFWRALPAICVFLHSQSVPLPPAHVWTALLVRFRATAHAVPGQEPHVDTSRSDDSLSPARRREAR